ncbi:hypothetical protein BX600DRAFT_432264 [Xylariales sp. PMI_506]|nr:hypothetical protein BX600DRAFT_432264 [Xylariales sp. PMI_506]
MQLSLLLLPVFGLATLARESYAPLISGQIQGRQLLTCNQTFGVGSEMCGGAGSTFCYNPSQGQTCCPDFGYCDQGSYCAPVAGYCCAEGEDLPTCAQNAGFTLPASLASSGASLPTSSFPTVPSSIAVNPFFSGAGPASTTVNALGNAAPTGSSPDSGDVLVTVSCSTLSTIVPSPVVTSSGTPFVVVSSTVRTIPGPESIVLALVMSAASAAVGGLLKL